MTDTKWKLQQREKLKETDTDDGERTILLLIENRIHEAKWTNSFPDLVQLFLKKKYVEIYEYIDSYQDPKYKALLTWLKEELIQRVLHTIDHCYQSITVEQLQKLLPSQVIETLQIDDYYYPPKSEQKQEGAPNFQNVAALSIMLQLNKVT
jgi:hypothetical protein